MKWMKFRLKTKEDAEDIISSALADLGIEGVQIEDRKPLTEEEKEQMFVDIPQELPPDDGIAYLSFYLDSDSDYGKKLDEVRKEIDSLRAFCDIGEGSIEVSETEDVDWQNNWKQYFKQFYVDDILVTPSWEEVRPEDRGRMVLRIDPGTAFGTGMHETTQLCIRALKKYLKPGDEVLDAGTGSGILSIAALKLGAAHAVGTDLDPCTVDAVAENKAANEIPDDDFRLYIGNLIDDEKTREAVGFDRYDIVTANILAEILVKMAPAIASAMKPGSISILSGILDGQQNKVTDACEKAGLEVIETGHQGEWVSVIARKTRAED
ncbi:MAG: 50S ribosomal protein L11 methyltransferase [Bilifractor sp.]|jgi:ribosomal protein L11 methyltransferase